MNKIKYIITILIIISMLLCSNNIVYAADQFAGTNGLNFIEQESNQNSFTPSSFVGDQIRLSYLQLIGTDSLYCVSHGKRIDGSSTRNYTIEDYILLEGDKATSANGTVVYHENNAILAAILGGAIETGYGKDEAHYNPAQKALWRFWDDWIDTVGTPNFGLTMFSNRTRNSRYVSTDAAKYVNYCKDLVKQGYKFGVGIYMLKDRSSGDYQELIFTVKRKLIEKPFIQITINKIDQDTGEYVPGVTFSIRNKVTNEYIQKINNDGTVVYTTNKSNAYLFKTGSESTGYKTITIEKMPAGTYIMTEENVENSIYNSPFNIGKEMEFTVVDKKEVNLQITNKKIDEPDEPEDDFDNEPGEGNVSISGTVWEDLFNGKGNNNNSIKDSQEKGIQGVKVYWRDSSGNLIASTKTDSSGNYTLKTTIEIKNHEYEIDEDAYDKLNNSYIEFSYNGLKYTTVVPAKTGSDTSKATEVDSTRTALDNSFDEINKQGVINNGILKYRLSYNESEHSSTLKQSINDFEVKANTQLTGIDNLLDEYASTETSKYCKKAHSCGKHDYHEHYIEDGYWDVETAVDENGNEYEVSRKWIDTSYWEGYDCTYDQYKDEWHIYNMNMGLVLREQPDISIKSDIEKVRVIMKGQEYTYVYNNRNIVQDNKNLAEYAVEFEKKYEPGVYTRPVNPSDIAYINKNSDTNMEVYVTYVMKVINQSDKLPIEIIELVNYYDPNYTVDITSSLQWSNNSKYGGANTNNGYKAAYYTNTIKVDPQKSSELISIEFKVNENTVEKLIEKDALLRNVVEINAYRTLYGSGVLCANGKYSQNIGKVGAQYAGIDRDSQPGSATPGQTNTYEDDTEEAPIFKLTQNEEPKVISGTVWEDTDANLSDSQRLGDGKNNSEKGVANVMVELISNKLHEEDKYADLYTIEGNTPKVKKAVTFTDENGHYKFEGVVTDNYIVKFTYGNGDKYDSDGNKITEATKINGHVINARNYKSTIITQEPIKSAIQGNENMKWHLTAPNDASVAVDDLNVRVSVPQLQYSNYNDAINMVAYSAPFELQIEYTENQIANVDANGGDFEQQLSIYDFGIIERPRENIVIDKTIENLRITLANGQVLTEGNPYTESLNYVKAIGTKNVNTRATALKANQKLLSIEMDSELIQGATLDILYAITVTNNSEKDYEYDSRLGGNEKYYYYGEIASPVIQQSAELVIDYVDTELTCTVDDEVNKNWKQYQAQELKDAGYISEATYNKVKAENYLIFVTAAFKDIPTGSSHKEYLHASKLLANQAEDYTYENHTEIIRVNGKVARTIDSVDDNTREQITKQYKPGTYIPDLQRKFAVTASTHKVSGVSGYKVVNGTLEQAGLHNQDDDMITIRITPPTGLASNVMIYVITAGIALVIIGIGIFIIKKKVL